MSPIIGGDDLLERRYINKFRALIEPFGEFIKYEYDRATIDLGLHLTEPSTTKKGARIENVSNTRVWFQLKGLHEKTLTREEYEKEDFVSYPIKVEQVKFWYASPEPIYLTIYIESMDVFLSEDIRDVVDKKWGESILNPATLGEQKEVSLRLEKKSVLTEEHVRNMSRHRFLRIDGPSFRGRTLGHRLDPLRCSLEPMEPEVFHAVVMRLLEEHKYKIEETIDPKALFPDGSDDVAVLLYGTLRFTYEWVHQFTTEFAPDSSGFSIEGSPSTAQGKCAVLIHSKVSNHPHTEASKEMIEVIKNKGVEHFLVFANLEIMDNIDYVAPFVSAQNETDFNVGVLPQGLSELAFSILVATLVYLDFRDRISFKMINYLWS